MLVKRGADREQDLKHGSRKNNKSNQKCQQVRAFGADDNDLLLDLS